MVSTGLSWRRPGQPAARQRPAHGLGLRAARRKGLIKIVGGKGEGGRLFRSYRRNQIGYNSRGEFTPLQRPQNTSVHLTSYPSVPSLDATPLGVQENLAFERSHCQQLSQYRDSGGL